MLMVEFNSGSIVGYLYFTLTTTNRVMLISLVGPSTPTRRGGCGTQISSTLLLGCIIIIIIIIIREDPL
jgi:hypothetical protein